MVATNASGLADVGAGGCGVITRISDDDPAVLRYLSGHGIAVGTHVRVLERHEGPGVVSVAVTSADDDAAPAGARAALGAVATEERIDLGLAAARTIWLGADAHQSSVRT